MSEVNSPLEDDQSATLVRGSVTGFEQGIAAVAGLFTAGPLGALASWAVIRGVQGKWTPWFIVGIPSAIAINAFYFGIFMLFGSAYFKMQESSLKSATPSTNPQVIEQAAKNVAITESPQPGQVSIISITDNTNGIKIARGALRYNNGNLIKGTFLVNCLNRTLEPRDFVFLSKEGQVIKSGVTWEPPFVTRWSAEVLMISKVCP